MIWSITLNAPLEKEPANPNLTMNPSKAPWYFLGFAGDARSISILGIAGVVMPSIIMIG